MGCLESKPVSEPPKNTKLETVYRGGKTDTKDKLKDITSSLPPNHQPSPPNQPSYPNYRAKFDKRVTSKYDVKALIGKGTHSKVVRVENRVSKEPYAIKIIDRTRASHMCASELHVLRRVRHPNIIKLVEVFEESLKLYLVIELATGGELCERVISKGSFSEPDSISTIKMLLEGVSYLHTLGITHRDLKPENILYYHPGNNSKLLITDFGLSTSDTTTPTTTITTTPTTPHENASTTSCGTPEYIAPEVLAKLSYNSQVDMWAVGVITYILLSGNMPFDDDNRTRMYRLILKANYYYDYDHWKDISTTAKDFIDSLLVVDASVRMSALMALQHPWISLPVVVNAEGDDSKDVSKSGGSHHNHTSSASSTSSHPHHHSNKGDSDKSSARSSRSGRSLKSLRSEHRRHQRRVVVGDIDKLHHDPEIQAELSSLTSWGNAKSTSSNMYY